MTPLERAQKTRRDAIAFLATLGIQLDVHHTADQWEEFDTRVQLLLARDRALFDDTIKKLLGPCLHEQVTTPQRKTVVQCAHCLQMIHTHVTEKRR